MSTCAKCGGYFSVTRQTSYCPECEKSNLSNVSTCDIPMPQGFGEQKGWICPVCGRGIAPWVDYCPCQGSEMKITYGTSMGTADEELNRLFELNNKRVDEMIEFENADLLEG